MFNVAIAGVCHCNADFENAAVQRKERRRIFERKTNKKFWEEVVAYFP
jgi:hypothetical protein